MREVSPFFINRTGPALEPEVLFQSEPGTLDLRDYWLKVHKHYRLMLACAGATILIVAIAVFSMRPLYTAQATLLIEREAPNVLDIRGVMSEPLSEGEYDYYKTQYELLRSRSLAAQVIRDQRLEENPAFASKRKSLISRFIEAAGAVITPKPKQYAHSGDKDLIDGVPGQLVEGYLSQLKIESVVGTKLVHIDFTSSDPVLAATVARAHSQAYIRQGLALQGGANDEARKFLEVKLVELKDRLEKSEAALNAYRRDKGIVSMDDKENTVVQGLDDLSKDLTGAQSDRIALQSQEELIRKRSYDSLPAVIDNPLIQQLKQEVSREEGQYASIASKFKAGYPALDQLHAQLTESQSRLRQEISAVVGGIESRYLAAKAKEESLQRAVDAQKRVALDQKDAGVQYAILNREVDTNRQLYDSVVKRAKETEVEADVKASNIYVIDTPEVPNHASHPQKAEDLIIAAFLGLLLGVALAFLLESLDNTLKNPEEVQRYLGLPSLAAVPNFASLGGTDLRAKKRSLLAFNGKNGKPAGHSKPNGTTPGNELLASNVGLLAAEFYRTIRSALLLSRAGEPPKVTMFTSAVDSEGKTLTAVNSAIAFANMEHRVLIIDADLRRPRCHTLLGIQNRIGLTEVLTGQVAIEDAISTTNVDNLFLLPCGAMPPNPAELVGSPKMKQLLAAVRESFDMVVVDTVPILLVSDAMPLSTMVDGTVIVVNGPGTAKHLVADACMRLHSVGAKILGIVLNNVDVRSPDYYYSHYHSYGGYSQYQSLDTPDLNGA